MIPSKSNTAESGCLPISSNCVIWQGDCLDCISVATGDTLSDVVFKLATDLCVLKEDLDLTDLDLQCLFEECALCPDPDKSISNVLTLLIGKVCTLEAALAALPTTSTPGTETDVVVSSCFQTTDLNGDLVTSLSEVDYLRAIGIKVCSIFSTVSSHTTSIADHASRIAALESEPEAVTLPTVTPSCVIAGATPQSLEDVLTAVEEQFCELRTVTGLPAELSLAVAKQCTDLNTADALGSTGTMSGIAGWETTVSTVADSLNNLWLTICDLRAAVASVSDCCSKTCADVIVNFLANVSDNGATLDLYFSGYTFLPTGFADCTVPGSKLTITDGLSGSHVVYVNLASQSASVTPLSIDITATPLNPSGNYTFTLESCVTNGEITCNKTVIVTATGTALSCEAPAIVSVALT